MPWLVDGFFAMMRWNQEYTGQSRFILLISRTKDRWRSALLAASDKELELLPTGAMPSSFEPVDDLKQFLRTASDLALPRQAPTIAQTACRENRFMSEKKTHEVSIMSEFVAAQAHATGTEQVIARVLCDPCQSEC